MNQSEFEAVACSRRQARGKKIRLSKPGFAFGFGTHWLGKCGSKFFHPITESNNAKPRQIRIAFDTLLKG